MTWSKDDAERALAAALLERDTPAAPSPTPVKTLAAMLEEYLAQKERGKRTIRNDRMAAERFKAAFGADTPLEDITAQRIAEWGRQRMARQSRLGRPLAPASLNRDLSILRHLLRLAEEWGYIDRVPKIRMEREPEGRQRFLTEDEAARLFAECRKAAEHPVSSCRSPHLEAIVALAIATGMRKGEIFGLRWERVDFARGVLMLDRTKNGRRREVPMTDTVYRILTALGPTASGPVFRRKDGEAWGSVRKAFTSAVEAAGLEDFRFHDLRHTCASWLVIRGRTLKDVQEQLGHQTLTMTLRYAKLSPERRRETASALDAPLARILSTTSAHEAGEATATLVSAREDSAEDQGCRRL
jgi:integrase